MTFPESAPTLKLLGGAVIQVGDTPLGGPAAHRHRLALLALLALSARPMSRDKLIALLWPERDSEAGRNLLKVAVHELRKLLGEHALRTTGDQLSIDSTLVHCDVSDFEAAVSASDLETAAGLYAGPFLDGFFLKDASEFERWADGERSRLAGSYARTLDHLASAAEKRGETQTAVRWWRALAKHDPLNTDVALRLMRALAAAGDRSGAIRHAEVHTLMRREDIGEEPDSAVAKLAKEIKESSAVAVSARVAPPNQLGTYAPLVVDAGDVRGNDLVFVARPSDSSRRRSFAWRRGLRPAATVVSLLGVAALVTTAVRSRTASTNPRLTPNLVAVFPFRVVGSDTSLAYLREGMMDLLAARLTGEGGQRAVDSRLALAAWRSAASGTGEMSVASALRVSRNLGAGQLLLGEAVGGQKGIELSVTLYRVPNGEVIARARRALESADELAPQVDRLAAELMSRAAGEPEDRLADLTSRPLPALRTYLAAQESYRGGRYARAESLFARALDIDPSFPLAGMGLALANSWTGINEHYGLGRDVALRGQASLSARDRAFLKAFFGPDPNMGQPQPAPVHLAAWEDVVHHWPDWAEAWYNLGDRYYHFGGLSGWADPLDRARAAFTRSLELDTAFTAPLHHLVEIYAMQGDAAKLRQTGERYFEHNRGVSRDASAIGWSMAIALHDDKWLARIRANFDSISPSDLTRIVWVTEANGWNPVDAERALTALDARSSATYEHENALFLRYAYSLNAGKPAAVRATTAAYDALLPDQPIGALLDLSATIFGDGDPGQGSPSARRLESFARTGLNGSPDRRSRQILALCLVGYWKSHHGEVATGQSDLREVQRRTAGLPAGDGAKREGRMCAAWLAASLAVDARAADASRLVAQLDTIVLEDRVPPRLGVAMGAIMSTRLREKLGQLAPALASSRWREHYTGAPIFLSTQLKDEGDLAERTGDRSGAIRAYRHYLALRPAAESGVAAEATEAVRKRLADLERR